jgi:hypothetical protein
MIKTASLIILSATIALLFSCKKKEPEQSCTNCSDPSPTPQGFSFTKNGGATLKADLRLLLC